MQRTPGQAPSAGLPGPGSGRLSSERVMALVVDERRACAPDPGGRAAANYAGRAGRHGLPPGARRADA
jgi:hypothetical protein